MFVSRALRRRFFRRCEKKRVLDKAGMAGHEPSWVADVAWIRRGPEIHLGVGRPCHNMRSMLDGVNRGAHIDALLGFPEHALQGWRYAIYRKTVI